jgi:glyoxylase I family protein
MVSSELAPPCLRGAHHFGFSVRDLDRSIRFYCDVLGAVLVRPPYSGDSPAFSGRMAIVAVGATGFDLFEHANNRQEPFDPARTGLDHLGFAAESIEELQSWAGWLDACNITHSGVREIVPGDTNGTDVEPIGAMLDFRDPDGIQLEFLFLDTAKIQRASVYDST